MVLSNKKLKQRIRQDLAESLSVSVSETNPQSQSLKLLLDSSSHKPRLSKREKRRNCETFAREDDEIRENEVGNGGSSEKTDTKIRKKRKRDDAVEVDELEGDEGTKEEEKPQKKKNKKKKKKKRKVNKTPKKAEEGNVEEKVKVEEIQVNTDK